jgi:hypothetical protein
MWIRTLGMEAFLLGLFTKMGDRTAVVQYFGYPGESRDVALLRVRHDPPDRRAAVDSLESMFTGFPGKLLPVADAARSFKATCGGESDRLLEATYYWPLVDWQISCIA